MRCRVGDLCVVIHDPDFRQEGFFVTILAPGKYPLTWAVHSPVKMRGFRRILGMRFTGMGHYMNVPDECLQPIRGLPKARQAQVDKPIEQPKRVKASVCNEEEAPGHSPAHRAQPGERVAPSDL